MVGILLVVICLLLLIIHRFRSDGRSTGSNLPPGQLGWPVIGETLMFAKQKVEFFRSRHEKYGRIFKTHLFGKPTIRVYGAENLRKIMSNEAKYVESCYPTSVRKLLGVDSISMSQGDLHVTKKQKLMKYLCPAFFQHHVPVFSSIIADRIQSWQKLVQINLHRECRRLFIELAVRFLISMDIDDDVLEEIRTHLDIFTDNIFCLPINLPGFAFRKALNAKKELRRIFHTYLTEKNYFDNNNDNELCSVLEDFRSKYSSKGDTKANELFLDSIIELLFAGAETASSAGFGLGYQLAKNGNCVDKLREELSAHDLLDLDQTVCVHDLKEMKYLNVVIQESLRTIPPIGGFFRTVKQDFQLEGYTVPAGWCLAFSIRDTHYTDSTSSGSVFDPQTCLQDKSSIDQYSNVPFGSGLRKCPGQAYAKIVLKLFVIELARQNGFQLIKDSPLEFWPTPRPREEVTVAFKSIPSSS